MSYKYLLLFQISIHFLIDRAGSFRFPHFKKLLSVKPIYESTVGLETDYLGMLNFCLRKTDSALSGQSRSKVLNAFTNEVFKSVMIGYEPAISDVLSRMGAYKDKIKSTDCFLGVEDDGLTVNTSDRLKACDSDLTRALDYVDSLENLITRGEIKDESDRGIYERGYTRLVEQLKDIGCLFTPNGVRRVDNNICLSLLDQCGEPSLETKTKELNKIANWVPRAIIYGESVDRNALADAIDTLTKPFANRWLDGNMNAQEIIFLHALSLLLREGVAAAESAIIYSENSSDKFGESNISGTLNEVMNLVTPPLRLFDPYLNTFQRIVTLCLKDLGARYWTVPQDEEVLGAFSSWEQSLRRNITGNYWNQNPAELVGRWKIMEIGSKGEMEDPFARPGAIAYSPSTGTVIATGTAETENTRNDGISNAAVESVYYLGQNSQYVEVELCSDGSVVLFPERGSGHEWRFKPGPAHLDTCEFYIRSNTDPDLVLQYVGYIDRGHRTECRFSGRPVRMTGRVQSYVKGILRGSMRFVMVQRKSSSYPSVFGK